MAIEFHEEAAVDDAPAMPARAAQGTSLAAQWQRLLQQQPKTADRIIFTEGLALQLESGVALHLALQSQQAQTANPAMRAIIVRLIQDVLEGRRFSDALARHPQLFSTTYVNLVAAGESGGFLSKGLAQLVDIDEKQEKLRATVTSALSYPAFLMLFSLGVVIFVLASVFPKFAVMFAPIQAQLPATTRMLMAASDMLLKYPLQLAAGTILLPMAAMHLLKRPAGRAWVDRMKLRLPLLKEIFIGIYLTRLMRTMGVSLQHGVTILATLQACREVVANIEFQSFILRLENQVSQGNTISAGFQRVSFIPAPVQQMITTGEQAGELGHVMSRIADFYERELTKKLNQLSKLAEPVMLLIMGGVVGIIVSSLILPIFKMSHAIH